MFADSPMAVLFKRHLRHYFSNATVLVDVLEQDNNQHISLITPKYTNMHQLFIFIQNILEMSTS